MWHAGRSAWIIDHQTCRLFLLSLMLADEVNWSQVITETFLTQTVHTYTLTHTGCKVCQSSKVINKGPLSTLSNWLPCCRLPLWPSITFSLKSTGVLIITDFINEIFCNKYPCSVSGSSGVALHSLSIRYKSPSVRTRAIKLTLRKWIEDYMRLLGGILRPSLNHVIPGRGKLWICGGKINAASPWDTTWDRSPSTKPSMSEEQRKREHKSGRHSERTKPEQVHSVSFDRTQSSNLGFHMRENDFPRISQEKFPRFQVGHMDWLHWPTVVGNK